MSTEQPPKRISSVKAYVDEIAKLRGEQKPENDELWFFRGQMNALWDVRPSIFRGDNLALEHKLIERAQRQNPTEFRDCSNNLEILTKLQHYGLGTRLLDVTLNPFVALFFATEPSKGYDKNKNGQYTLQEHDGRVYYGFANALSLNEIQIKIALELPFLELSKTIGSLKEFYDHLKERNVISSREYDDLVKNDYEQGINSLQKNSFIVPTNSNIRLIQQRGAFLVASSINIKTINTVETSLLSKAKRDLSGEFGGSFIILAKDKSSIRKELDFFNVNEATLFPELERQMHYIQNQEQASTTTVEEYSDGICSYTSASGIPTEIDVSDVRSIIDEYLISIDEDFRNNLVDSIIKLMVIDWQSKDSVVSSIRRCIKKTILEVYSSAEAGSKAKEIVNKLLVK